MGDDMSGRIARAVTVSLSGLAGGIIAGFFGAWDNGIIALIVFMGVDTVMGMLSAALFGRSDKTPSGRLSSSAAFKGIVRKVCILLLVASANQADRILGTAYLRNAVVFAFCASELISICENASAMGIMPRNVQRIFAGMIDLISEKEEDDGTQKGS
ncbi:MAG: phage holin family protein [Oscillospiraceae bacterium]|nr:phage holin family protein [Oscillospiraceae bacterium]